MLTVESIEFGFATTAPTEISVPMYMISTRESTSYEGEEGIGYGNYSFLNINELLVSCPSEVTVIVHGWDVDETEAKERFES
ncbi:MAG: hypothetical protein WBX81_17730 [Nitrososphaeraceae archaeon]